MKKTNVYIKQKDLANGWAIYHEFDNSEVDLGFDGYNEASTHADVMGWTVVTAPSTNIEQDDEFIELDVPIKTPLWEDDNEQYKNMYYALNDAIERMDRARNILHKDGNSQWNMLDTESLKSILQKATPIK